MAEKDIIRMSQRELKCLHVLHKIMDKKLSQVEGSKMLSLSDRQIRRMIKRISKEGDSGIGHKLRGKKSGRAIPKKIKQRVIAAYRKKYGDFGPTLASEKLHEIDGLAISRESLRSWLIATGDWKGQRNGRQHRKWRERKGHRGEMVQMDGSHHEWFEKRGSGCVLMGYIDDATSEVYGRFYEYEGTLPAMDSFKRYCLKYGVPLSIYLDRHSTYKSPAKASIADELANTEPKSQFQRALQEMGVKVIHAYSPQAKGRIERLFRTFQDRVIKEMRLKNICNPEEGNNFLKIYLPGYNRRYGVKAKFDEDMHRPIRPDEKIEKILCIQNARTVRNDFTIIHEKKRYQLYDAIRGKTVKVEERVDGTLHVIYQEKELRYKEVDRWIKREEEKKAPSINTHKKVIPAKDHPWRQAYSKKIRGHKEIIQGEELLATG